MKRIALYDPYLDTLGGGEKHILSIVEVLADMGCEVNIFWDKNLNDRIRDRFSLKHVMDYRYLPNIFKKSDPLTTFKTLLPFDYFFYVTDGSYFASGARNNFVFAMVPDKKLYSLNIVNRLKLWNYRFISNSPYTTRWLDDWGIKPVTIAPALPPDMFEEKPLKKDKIILSVARFFPHLHSKNHPAIISTFKALKKNRPAFKDYKLVLAGGLKDEDKDYFNKLKEMAKEDKSIIFRTNIPKSELVNLYGSSTYFWHFTGFGVDEKNHPEMVEHFGIAPLEAMAKKNVVFCHNSGGPKEFIRDGENGFLFDNPEDIIDKMERTVEDSRLRREIGDLAYVTAKKRYNYETFKDNVTSLL